MKKYTAFFVFGLVLFISAGSAFAQPGPTGQFNYGFLGPQVFSGQMAYGFPGQAQTVSATQAMTLGHKMPVAMTGSLVQFYGGKDLYVFRDSSGDILVKIGPKEWQNLFYQGGNRDSLNQGTAGSVGVQEINIVPSDTIEIYGEVHWPKHSWGTPEVHVRFIRKV